MIAPDIRQRIDAKLAAAATAHDVRILYAAESGSRAWGFGSPDSDFDVRFIYVHPRDWYLRLAEPRDVIEEGIDAHLIDCNGWDLRKALRLLLKSNPVLHEWLVSPIVYTDDGDFRPAARDLFERHATPRALAAHYWSIARGQWQREIDGREAVRLKKYVYIIRPLLALQWVVTRRTPPPMHIDALLAAVPLVGVVRDEIDRLLDLKRRTPELGLGPRLAIIEAWALERLDALAPARLALPDADTGATTAEADRLFRRLLGAGS